MHVLVVAAHPSENSYGAVLCRTAVQSLEGAGHTVDLMDLYAEHFEPVLSPEEALNHRAGIDALPGVAEYAARLGRADALVLVYPTFWGAQPAIMKGWFDRVLCEGVAYTLPEGANRIRPLLRHIRHLVVVTTYGSPRWVNLLQGEPGRRTVRWQLRALTHPLCRSPWLACYGMDTGGEAERSAFLERVNRRMARL